EYPKLGTHPPAQQRSGLLELEINLLAIAS
ncbi:MAG: hypothetical protein ACI94L_001535, partial [Flavobacteriaceae bacterium]